MSINELPIELINIIVDYLDYPSKYCFSLTNRVVIKKYNRTSGYRSLQSLYESTAYWGYINIIKWLNTRVYIINKFIGSAACCSGNLELVEYMADRCHYNEYWCSKAAASGHFHILKWLRERKCRWNYYTCVGAAMSGRLDILQYCISNGCDYNDLTYKYACKYGNLNIIEWLYDNNYPIYKYHDILYTISCYKGHLNVLKWLLMCKIKVSITQCYKCAIKKERINILEWLRLNNYCPDISCDLYLTSIDNYKVNPLKWLRDNNFCYSNINYCQRAFNLNLSHIIFKSESYKTNLKNKRIEILEWFKNNHCTCNGKYHYF